jgi:hypothetical protein
MFEDLPLFSAQPRAIAAVPLFAEPFTAPHNGTDTSAAAALAIQPFLSGLRLRIYRALELAEDGFTCEQLEHLLGIKHQTASARLRELHDRGYVTLRVDRSGTILKRRTTSGCLARIYFPAKQ